MPQMKGPRKKDPRAPHEMPRMATMVSRSSQASTTERKTKNPLPMRISMVSLRSEASLLMNP